MALSNDELNKSIVIYIQNPPIIFKRIIFSIDEILNICLIVSWNEICDLDTIIHLKLF